jgi:EmrB/QacA subfamily drug resistance transporter
VLLWARRDGVNGGGVEEKGQLPATGGRATGLALALLCVAQFVNVLGVTVVIVALPSIGRSLGLSEVSLQWVAGAYALFFGGFLLLCGRAADLYGRRLFFVIGLGLFVVSSLICGLANSLPVLVAARAAQGLGAAMVVPAALSILTTIFREGEERDRAVGVWTAVAAGGGAAGFFLGGMVSEALGWEWVFFLNAPVGVLGMILAPALLPESRDTQASRRLDVLGALSITTGLLLLIYALTRAEESGFGSGTLGILGLAVASILAFFAVEATVADPLVPLRVLRSRTLTGSSSVAFALTATTSPAAVVGTLYLQNVLDYSPTATGLAYAPFSAAVVGGSFTGARLAGRIGPRTTMVCGLAAVASAMLASSGIGADAGVPYLLTGIVVSGWGLGCAAVASTAAGVSVVTEEKRGLAAGVLNAAAQIGTAVGIAALVAVAAARTGAIPGDAKSAAALVAGYRLAFLVAAGVAFAGALGALGLIRRAQA